jgi:hypothetical protein
MTFLFDERPDSRSIQVDPPMLTLRYTAAGEFDENTVLGYALSATPTSIFTTMGQLWRQPLNLDPDGWSRYVVTVPYGQRQRDTGSIGFSFDATGASIRIKASKEVIQSYPAPGVTAVDHKGSIGVSDNGEVEGTDIIVPALSMTYDYRYPEGVVDESFARFCAGAVAHTNENSWRGFQAGELLLVGISGSGSESESSAQVKVLASQNASSLTIGEITGIVKQGHHYLDILFMDTVTSNRRVRKPKQVTVHRVYDPIDFASVLGFE